MEQRTEGAPGAPPAEGARAPQAVLSRSAAFQPATFDVAARTVEVVFTTGADVPRTDWWSGERWVERLRVTPEAVDLSRLNAGAPVLDSHQSYELRNVIGVVERAWIANGEGRALLRFSDRPEIAPIVADVQAGILRNISAGYWVEQWQITEATANSALVKEAIRWMPGELSLVPVPADAGAGVRAATPAAPSASPRVGAAAHNPEVRMSGSQQPGAQGASDSTQNPAPAAPASQPVNAEAERAAVREAELGRARDIRAAGTALGLAERAEQLVADGSSLADAQAALIRDLAARNAAQQQPRPAAIQVVQDEGVTARRGLQDALLHRAGLLQNADGAPAALPEAARQYRGFRLRDYAAECITLRGGSVRGLAPAEVAQAALGNREMMSRAGIAAHSTSDFPNLLANTASKALGQGYGSARRTFTRWGRRRTLPDFKSFRVVNLGGAPSLGSMAEGAEVTWGTVGEGAETYNLFRAGRRVGLTFETIINDDMDAFTRLPQMFGAAAARLESETVYGIFNSNPAMADAVALFAVSHVNVFGDGVTGYSTGDGVLNVTGLQKGRSILRSQTAPNGDVLDLTPRYLLVPDELEAAAYQFTSSQYVASAPGNQNPYAGTLEPIVEPRLTSAAQWYLIADSAEVDTVEYAYLEGMEAPQITSYVDDDTDGVIVKCTHSFGAKATDFRGMARSTGA